MKYTANYNLKKPEGTDTINIDDFNNNADILDAEINSINEQIDNITAQDDSFREQINTLDANKADLVNGKVPSSQLTNIEALVQSVNGKTGSVVLTKSDVGLGNADNTADNTKTVLSATKLATPRAINGVNFNGTGNITIADSTKAPIAHASTGTGYGVGTTSNYGHVKTINVLTQTSHVDGTALSAYQGKVLTDKMKYNIVTLTSSQSWTIPPGVTELDVVAINGGYGGGGGGAALTERGNDDGVYYYRAGGDGGDGGDSGSARYGKFSYFKGDFNLGQTLICTVGAGGVGAAGAINGTSPISPVAGGISGIDGFFKSNNYNVPGGWRYVVNPAYKGYGGSGGKSTTNAGTSGTQNSAGGPGRQSDEEGSIPDAFLPGKKFGSGAGGGGGACFVGGTYAVGGIAVKTGAGNGGRGGALGAVGVSGSNATIYGHGGGGGGGSGCDVSQPSSNQYTFRNNSSTKGGNGYQGVIYIGYRTFSE